MLFITKISRILSIGPNVTRAIAKSGISRFLSVSLLLQVLSIIAPPSAQASLTCTENISPANSISVTATHGTSMYVDLKSSPRLNSSYIGYKLTSSTNLTNIWVKVSSFSAASGSALITLASSELSESQQIATLNSGASNAKSSFFLIKASATTTVDQSHTIQIYSGDPSLGGTLSETCTFTFTAVVATIAASSNKVTSVSTSNANPKLGELLTITTLGETGQIGNGDNSGDRDLIWFSPSVFSNFPSTALRLESTSIQINFTSGVTNSGGNACSVYTSGSSYTYTDQLFIGDAIDCHNQTTYSATFNFRVIGRAATTFSLQPVAQISSGAKYKHTSLAGSASLTIDVTNVSAAITVDKSANTIGLPSPVDGSTFSGGVSGRNYILVPYKIRATSNSATITNLDKVLDDYPVGSVFKASSATYSAYGVSTTSITPIDSGGILYFTGPFGVSNSSASTELNLDYSMYVLLPTSGTSTAINTAYGLIGEKVVGSSTSQVAGISISTDSSSITGQSDADTAVAPEVVTQFATSVGKISATLNGTVDANGSSTVVSFCWGSNSNLSGCTSITPTGSPTASDEPVSFSANVTGLNASQTYYFRITGGSVDGSIRNFTTLDETALSITTASLANGTVSSAYSQTLTATGGATSGGDCVSGEGTNSGYVWSLTSGTLPTGITLTSSSTTATLSGTPTTAGNYSFTIQVIDCSGTTASLAYSIEVIGVPSATTVAASSLTSTSATLNGTINANNSSTTVTFCYGVDPTLNTCTSVGATTNGTVTGTSNTSATYNATSLTTGTTYYFRVIGVNSAGTTQGTILNFTPTLTAPTITLSYTDITYGDSSNASPTLTENSDGTSTAYSTSSSSICSVNSSTGVITVLTAGNCVVTVSITNGTNYADGSASDTFVISKKALTVTPTARSLIYGDAEGSYPFTVTGFIAGENESNSANYVAPTCDSDYTSSTSVSSSPRTISCSSGSATNYSFIVTATANLAIARADQSVTWTPTSTLSTSSGSATLSGASGSGGGSITYSVVTPSVTGSPNCSVVGFILSWTASATGTCLLRATAGITTNYNSGSTEVTFNITALTAPTITLSYTDITYGDSSNASPTLTENSDGTSTAYSTSSSSICSVNSSTGVITVLTAGNCVVTVSITNGTNYADGSASDTFVISKKALTVTPTARSLIYGDAEGSYPFTVTGFIAGENESNSANYVAPTCDSDYTSSTSVSSSPRTISCSSGSATNYSFIVTATTELTISNPSAVTKVAEVLSKNRAKLKGESDRTLDNPKFCLNSSSFANKSQCDVGGTQADASLDGSEYVFDATTLSPSTTYYYVIHGRVGGSTFAGEVRSFKTKPEVVTKAGSSVAARSAKLNATVSEALTDPKFCYKATSFSSLVQCLDGGATATATTGTSPLVRSIGFLKKSETLKPFGLLIGKGVTTPSQSVATDVNYELPVSGLNPSTTYYFIIYGKVGSGAEETTYDGGVQNFTTPAEESGSSGGGSGGSSGGSEGGSGSTTTEPTPPPGPRIFSLSKTLACYTGTDVTISGAYFGEGKVTLDGIAVVIKEFSDSSLRVTLPSSSAGRRTISVTTPNGSAIAYIDYSSVPKPIFESIRIPYLSQGSLLSLPFVATNTTSYGFIGKLPAGLTLNASTGEISGTPTENGIFILTLTASNLCGQTQQFVELDIDAPTPNAISHRINFLPGSCSIPDSAKASLEAFLTKAKGLSPRNIIPEIYVSGGGKASDPNSPLADCRQEAICDFLLLEDLLGEVLSDVFTGAENRIEIIVYWPRPNDGQ